MTPNDVSLDAFHFVRLCHEHDCPAMLLPKPSSPRGLEISGNDRWIVCMQNSPCGGQGLIVH